MLIFLPPSGLDKLQPLSSLSNCNCIFIPSRLNHALLNCFVLSHFRNKTNLQLIQARCSGSKTNNVFTPLLKNKTHSDLCLQYMISYVTAHLCGAYPVIVCHCAYTAYHCARISLYIHCLSLYMEFLLCHFISLYTHAYRCRCIPITSLYIPV